MRAVSLPRRTKVFDPAIGSGVGRGRGGTSNKGGDRGGALRATETRPLRHKKDPSSDDWPIAEGPQGGSMSKKVIPLQAEIV